MAESAQDKAVQTYRARQTLRGLRRFEVTAPEGDRDLLRKLARKLAEAGPTAEAARAAVQAAVAEPVAAGGILAALRRSPLVGADLDLTRSRDTERPVDL